MAAKKPSALGKGLSALLGNTDVSMNDAGVSVLTAELSYIPTDKIVPNPDQPRKEFDNEKLEELAQSIKENGVIVPLTVIKENGKYVLIAGERRYRAAKSVGLKELPAYIKVATKRKLWKWLLWRIFRERTSMPSK